MQRVSPLGVVTLTAQLCSLPHLQSLPHRSAVTGKTQHLLQEGDSVLPMQIPKGGAHWFSLSHMFSSNPINCGGWGHVVQKEWGGGPKEVNRHQNNLLSQAKAPLCYVISPSFHVLVWFLTETV